MVIQHGATSAHMTSCYALAARHEASYACCLNTALECGVALQPHIPAHHFIGATHDIDFLSSSHRSLACSHAHGKKASPKRCRSTSPFGPRRGRLAPVQTGQDRGYAGCWIQTSGNILENILSRTFVNKAAVEAAWDGGYAKRVRPALD